MRSARPAVNSAATSSWTMKRFAAMQAWPMARILAATAPSTAAGTSASSKTTNGALPPSSIERRRPCRTAVAASDWPTGEEPVNESLRRRGSARTASVTACERQVRTLTTPSGRPTSARTFANSSVVRGVALAGRTTTVQPAARAGAILRVAMASGKFHGVMSRQGPTGRLVTSWRMPPSGVAAQRPAMRTACSENQRRNSAP